MNKSVWQDNIKMRETPSLVGDIKTDVLIIGGGLAGVLTAYILKEKGIDCIVAEAEKTGFGTTKNTTGKITFQHGLIYEKLLNSFGKEIASGHLGAHKKALLKYEELAKGIDCDFEQRDNYVYSLTDREKCENEVAALEKIGYKALFCESTELPFKTAGAVKFEKQAQFNPMKFLSGIAGGLNIYENTRILSVEDNVAFGERGTIAAEKIIVATHFPFLNLHGSYFLKLYQHRSYVLGLKGAADLVGMYVDEDKTGLSFRNYGDLLLLGGGSHRTGSKGGGWAELRRFAKENYPDATEQYHWAAQDCMSLDGMAYIGNYSKHTPNVYVATGFNKWGMTGAMVSAQLLADAVSGVKNEYAEVFSPSRSILKPQLLVNGAHSVANLLMPTKKRCTHLGCALKWNPQEHSWDCPCHGSRFTAEGKVLENPANKNLRE